MKEWTKWTDEAKKITGKTSAHFFLKSKFKRFYHLINWYALLLIEIESFFNRRKSFFQKSEKIARIIILSNVGGSNRKFAWVIFV